MVLWHKIMFLIFVWECFGHVSLLLLPAPLCCLLTTAAQDTHTQSTEYSAEDIPFDCSQLQLHLLVRLQLRLRSSHADCAQLALVCFGFARKML